MAFACGGGHTSEPPPAKKDAGPPDAATLDVPARALGMPDLASYGWRRRGGHPAFRIARKAEAANDWPTVVTTCKQALAADPGHLEAQWLLAAGLGKLGKHDELLAPLQAAAAGDFGKWGPASLELPELQPFLATPIGEAWRRRVDADRAAYVAVLGRSVIVASRGDLYAYDADGKRWYRLTRTYGAVMGALRITPTRLAYIARQRGADKKTTLAAGIIDLARGRTMRPIELGTKGPLVVAAIPPGQPNSGVWIGNLQTWRRIDDDYHLVPVVGKAGRPPGPWLEVFKKTVRLHALPVSGVSADWDDKGLTNAARVGKSNRVITVPAPGQIDGNSATWSPDRAHLAFVAQLDDRCAPNAINAAAFVADATTGTVTELERAADGLAVEWVGDHQLAVAGDKGVSIVNLDDRTTIALDGTDGLVPPRRRPTCTPDAEEPPPEDPDAADPAGESGDVKLVEPQR